MTEVVEKTVVRPNTESYTKTRTASGNTSLHNGDPVASKLVELLLDEVYAVASKLLGVDVDTLVEKYKHLNLGMQRMNLGNRIRGAVAKIDKGNEKEVNAVIKANEKATKKYEAEVAKAKEGEEAPQLVLAEVPELVEGKGLETFESACAEFGPAIAQRAEEAAAAKAEKEAEALRKAEEKAAKEAEKKAKKEAAAAAKAAEAE